MIPRLGVSNLAWPAEDEEEAFEILRSFGVAGVEVAPARLGNWRELQPFFLAKYVEKLAGFGLQPCSMQAITYGIEGASLLGTPGEFAALRAHLIKVSHIAESLGVRHAVFGSPNMRKLNGAPIATVGKVAAHRLSDIGYAISKGGVRIAIEPVPAYYGNEFLLSLDETADFVEGLKNPFVATMVDTACMTLNERAGNGSASDMIARHAEQIAHVHISEPDLRPIGRAGSAGGINEHPVDHKRFARLFHKLRKRLRPELWYVIEMKETPDWRRDLAETLSRVTDIYAPAVPAKPLPPAATERHSRPRVVPALGDDERAFPHEAPKNLDFSSVPVDPKSGVATWTVYPAETIPASPLSADTAIFGPGLVQTLALPATTISYCRDVEIFGRGIALTRSGKLLLETNLRQYIATDLGNGNAIVQHPPSVVRDRRRETDDGRPLILLNAVWPVHYGHWLYDNFARLGALSDFFQIPLSELGKHFRICLGYADVSAAWLKEGTPQRNHLQLAGFDESNIVALPSFEWARFSDVLIVSSMNNFAPPIRSIFMRPEVKKAFASLAEGVRRPGFGKRIYVARTDTQNRLMENEKEIAEYLCRQHDFVWTECAKLNAEQQVAVFRDAEIVVGPIGNAFMNLAFSNPDAKVIILAPKETTHFLPYYQGISTAFGNKVVVLAGETTKTAADLNKLQWRGDLEALKLELEDVIEES